MDELKQVINEIKSSSDEVSGEIARRYKQLIPWLEELVHYREDEAQRRYVAKENYYAYCLQQERIERMKELMYNIKACSPEQHHLFYDEIEELCDDSYWK